MNREAINSLREIVSEDAWQHRKAFVGFNSTDETILRELRPVWQWGSAALLGALAVSALGPPAGVR